MPGTLTVTNASVGNGLVKYTLDWLSDAGGDVSGNNVDVIPGYVVQVGFNPDGGGTAPTASYDVVLTDPDGIDLLGGAGANLSATATTVVAVVTPLHYDGGALDLVVSNAGNAKGGLVLLWVGQPRP